MMSLLVDNIYAIAAYRRYFWYEGHTRKGQIVADAGSDAPDRLGAKHSAGRNGAGRRASS